MAFVVVRLIHKEYGGVKVSKEERALCDGREPRGVKTRVKFTMITNTEKSSVG